MMPRIYDALMKPLEARVILRMRRRALRDVGGLVLDIGAGTGANLGLFAPGARVVALDRDEPMLRRLRKKPGPAPLATVRADGQLLPFRAGSFDAVVFTLVLCTIPRPAEAVSEALRVLRPGGVLVTVEHVLAPGRLLSVTQRALTPAWKHLAGGCHLDRDTEGLLAGAGLTPAQRAVAARGIIVASSWRRAGEEGLAATTP